MRRVGAMIVDLKIVIGTHSKEYDEYPRMDPGMKAAVMDLVDRSETVLMRDMSEEDWQWWRLSEHVKEVVRPTQTIREWMKLDPSDEEEPRIVEVCEAQRADLGGPCDALLAAAGLNLCERVSRRVTLIHQMLADAHIFSVQCESVAYCSRSKSLGEDDKPSQTKTILTFQGIKKRIGKNTRWHAVRHDGDGLGI